MQHSTQVYQAQVPFIKKKKTMLKTQKPLSAIIVPMLKTIYARKQWIVLLNAKNRFYECSKQIRIYSKHDV